ncbi:hypothetical protein B7463_g2253, partial [Scytalidium lignicola]
MFEDVQLGPQDPMFNLKKLADNDSSPKKIDLGVGIYRNEKGKYHELQAINKYELTTGNPSFLKNAASVIFGKDCEALRAGRITSVQTISGTGACHLAALFLTRCATFEHKQRVVYLGTPAWGNYEPLCQLVGFEVVKYRYYNAEKSKVDFDTLLNTVSMAPANSVFIVQGCCHNPTGVDLTQVQWRSLTEAMKKAQVFPFFDIAYQGLGSSMEDDSFGIRLFTQMGFEMVVCQSFSKNFGLYGERCGVLHVVTHDATTSNNVYDQLRCLIRWEFSSSPAYGSRLVNIIIENSYLEELWLSELSTMRHRLLENRHKLYQRLMNVYKTPGNWEALQTTTGLFCLLPLSGEQITELRDRHHIYIPDNGRINIAGLNPDNLNLVASAIDEVVKKTSRQVGTHN